jgi:hypothetical protein
MKSIRLPYFQENKNGGKAVMGRIVTVKLARRDFLDLKGRKRNENPLTHF